MPERGTFGEAKVSQSQLRGYNLLIFGSMSDEIDAITPKAGEELAPGAQRSSTLCRRSGVQIVSRA